MSITVTHLEPSKRHRLLARGNSTLLSTFSLRGRLNVCDMTWDPGWHFVKTCGKGMDKKKSADSRNVIYGRPPGLKIQRQLLWLQPFRVPFLVWSPLSIALPTSGAIMRLHIIFHLQQHVSIAMLTLFHIIDNQRLSRAFSRWLSLSLFASYDSKTCTSV